MIELAARPVFECTDVKYSSGFYFISLSAFSVSEY